MAFPFLALPRNTWVIVMLPIYCLATLLFTKIFLTKLPTKVRPLAHLMALQRGQYSWEGDDNDQHGLTPATHHGVQRNHCELRCLEETRDYCTCGGMGKKTENNICKVQKSRVVFWCCKSRTANWTSHTDSFCIVIWSSRWCKHDGMPFFDVTLEGGSLFYL